MKTHYYSQVLLIIISILFNNQVSGTHFITAAPTDTCFNILTNEDKLNYMLTISLGEIIENHCDTSNEFYKLNAVRKVNVALKNNSYDTLKYIDWTCSSEIWDIDNKSLKALPPFIIENCGDCTKNIINEFDVPPHQVKDLYVYVCRRNFTNKNPKFKIGMILQRVKRKEDFCFYMNYFFGTKHNLSDQTMNFVWSNSIQMP